MMKADEGTTMMNRNDEQFLLQYNEWMYPTPGLLAAIRERMEPTLEAIRFNDMKDLLSRFGDKISESQVMDIVKESAAGVVEVMNEIAAGTIPYEHLRAKQAERFRLDSFGLHNAHTVEYRALRKTLRWDKKIGLFGGFGEGAVTGFFGGPGLLVDIPILVVATMRASLVMATKHGVEIEDDLEMAFALQAAFSGGKGKKGARKAVFARELHVIAKQVAQKKTWKELEERGLVKLAQKLAEILAIRLTKAKLAAAIPLVGSVISGGFNAHWMASTHRDLEFVYGRRFLDAQYGAPRVEAYLERLEHG